MGGRTTIYDVARACGVSPATVSRALAQPDKVHPETLEQVLAAAERLGYRKLASTRAAGARHTGTIAMVVPDITNPYFPPLFRAIQAAAAGADGGTSVVLADTLGMTPPQIERVRAARRGDALDVAGADLLDRLSS